MSKSIEILSTRLANGEITETEYDRLAAKMNAATSTNAAASVEAVKDAVAINGKSWAGWIGAGIVVMIIISALGSAKQGRTHITSLRSSGFFGDIISGELLTHGKSGRVYTWIEKSGKKMCPRSVYLQQNRPRKFEFRCSRAANVKGSTFTMKTNRSPDTWVKRNAMSL